MATNNPHFETSTQVESTARALTTAAEHGQSVTKELDAMTPAEKVLIAHKMETLNDGDRKTDKHLPKLDISFTTDFGSGSDSSKSTQPTAANGEHLNKITAIKDPDAIFFKDKEDIYNNKDLNKELYASLDKLISPEVKKEMERVAAERKKIIDSLSPEQRQQYDRESAIKEQWEKACADKLSDFYNSPGFHGSWEPKLPERPSTPLRDGIEAMTNKNGKRDFEIFDHSDADRKDNPFDPGRIGTDIPIRPATPIIDVPREPKVSGLGGPAWTKPLDMFPHSNDPNTHIVLP